MRHYNLAINEVGTHAMPSGDTAQGALYFTIVQLFFFNDMQIPIILIFGSILVGFSRVYFRCHWIGDVIIGAEVGIGEGILVHKYFITIGTSIIKVLPEVFINF